MYEQVRTVNQYENFGMHISAANADGNRATDTDVAAQLLTEQVAEHSARSETYCDIVVLAVADLADIFTQQQMWSKLAAHRKRRPPARAHGVTKAAVFAKLMSRASTSGSFRKRKVTGSEIESAAAQTNSPGSRRLRWSTRRVSREAKKAAPWV